MPSKHWMLESTERCSGAMPVLFSLELLQLSYTYGLRPDGYFLQTHQGPGPLLLGGTRKFLGFRPTMLALAAEANFTPEQLRAVGELFTLAQLEAAPAFAKARAGVDTAEREQALLTLRGVFRQLEARLQDQLFLLGNECSLADVPWTILPSDGPLAALLPPTVRSYLDRVRATPAYARAAARKSAALFLETPPAHA